MVADVESGKKKTTKAKPPPQIEAKPSEEEFEEKELVVKEFIHGDKEYYIDEEQTIYEKEYLIKIGKLVNGKLVML